MARKKREGGDMAQELVAIERRNPGDGRTVVRGVFGSIYRICRAAQEMLSRDARWRLKSGAGTEGVIDVVFDSVRECEQDYRQWRRDRAAGAPGLCPHPVGMIAEQLAAKTIASFGGQEAVDDLEKWTRRAQNRLRT